MPLAPRVQILVRKLENDRKFRCWSSMQPALAHGNPSGNAPGTIIECFPAEAIWAAKRLDCYKDSSAAVVKSYKRQKGVKLEADDVKCLAEKVLLGFEKLTGLSQWPGIVQTLIDQMLDREEFWVRQPAGSPPKRQYRGGKLLDDVVDSAICLATAISYARVRPPNHVNTRL